MKKIASIYLVTNKIDGKKYVGFTTQSVAKRWKYHVYMATNRYSHSALSSIYFYDAIRKHGPDSFEVTVLHTSDDLEDALHVQEPYFIARYNTHFTTGLGYNMTFGGEGTIGLVRTPEQIKAMSDRNKGRKLSDDCKKRLSVANSGENNPRYGTSWSEETRAKIVSQLRGKCRGPMPESTRTKISLANKGKPRRPLTNEEKQARSQSSLGRIHSEDTKRKIGVAHRGKSVSSATKDKLKEAFSSQWIIRSPDGVEHNITNLVSFCKENNLSRSPLRRSLLSGKPCQAGKSCGWQLLAKKGD